MSSNHYYGVVRYDDASLEHRSHKYIKRERTSSGKYRYWYPRDIKSGSSRTSLADRISNSLRSAGKKIDNEYNKRSGANLTKEQQYYKDESDMLKLRAEETGYRAAAKVNLTKSQYYWNRIKKSSDLGTKYWKKLASSLSRAATNKAKEYATKGKYYLKYLMTDIKRVNNGTSKKRITGKRIG